MIEIEIPTLLIDESKVRKNIQRMSQKVRNSGIKFRPHFKAHQSRHIGRIFKEVGVDSITVSSVSMAEYFSDDWNDILIAFPVNILEAEKINELAKKVKLSLLFDQIDQVFALNNRLQHTCDAFIKIDTGNKRAGIPFDDITAITELADSLNSSQNLKLTGLLSHAGQSYLTSDPDEIIDIYKGNLTALSDVRKALSHISNDLLLSTGDTPTSSIVEDLSGIDELRPGVFVYYDMMMEEIGACSTDDIAIAMACPVISKYEERNEILIYGGAVHFSKEKLVKNNLSYYGAVVKFNNGYNRSEPVKDTYLYRISQEHGLIRASDEFFAAVNVGDVIGILPVHACLTVDIAAEIKNTDGNPIDRM